MLISKAIKYSLGQGVAQILAFVTGILIVRSMEKHDYAYYSIAVALIAATALVAEGGLNAVLMSRGADARKNGAATDSLFATAMRFRFVAGTPFIILGTVAAVVLMVQNGMPTSTLVICAALMIATLMTTVTSGTLLTYHRLNLSTELIRGTTLGVTAVRLLLVAALVGLASATVPLVLTVGLLCAAATAFIYRRVVSREIDLRATRSKSDWTAFVVSAKRTLPMNMMLVLSEQSILVFLSIFGSPQIIANVSALSRFSIAFVVINLLIADLGAPLIARTNAATSAVSKKFAVILGSYFTLSLTLIAIVYFNATWLLSILGTKYSGLETPLVIIAAGSACLNMGYAFSSMNQARGWTKYSWVYLPMIVVWALIGLTVFDLTSTLGAAGFMATQALPSLLVQIIRFMAGISRLRNQGHSTSELAS